MCYHVVNLLLKPWVKQKTLKGLADDTKGTFTVISRGMKNDKAKVKCAKITVHKTQHTKI